MKNILLVLLVLIYSIGQAQIVTIPDANFKNALVNTNCIDTNADGIPDTDADTNNDGEIQVSEAEAIIRLYVSSQGINSLEGIQSFSNLLTLKCDENNLSILDVTQNLSLQKLYCARNQLTDIDVTQNLNLLALSCGQNQLTNIDVSQNLNLLELSFGTNQLTSLDISQNTNLEFLQCWKNELTSLDVAQNPSLETLSCSENQLSSLDVTENPNLIMLSCGRNELTNLNLKNGNNVVLIDMVATLNPNLGCIQVDDVNYAQNAPNWAKDATAIYSENCALGVQNFDLNDFSLTPNPTQDLLNINTENQIETIKIFSLQGELLLQTSDSNIDVSQFNSGLYFIQVSITGKIISKKFIKI